MTLLEYRTQSRQRSNQENSTFVTNSELNAYINSSAKELYDLLIQKYGSFYFHKTYTFNLVNNQESYNLPSDFYKLAGVEMQVDSNNWVTLQRFNWAERNRYTNYFFGFMGNDVAYSLVGNKIRFMPTPNLTNAIRMDYNPLMVNMSADTDTFDGFNGWDEYIVVDAARKMALKENDNELADRLAGEKQGLIDRISSAAGNRDAANPKTITNINNQNPFWPFRRY